MPISVAKQGRGTAFASNFVNKIQFDWLKAISMIAEQIYLQKNGANILQ
jgi:hypothetical protein